MFGIIATLAGIGAFLYSLNGGADVVPALISGVIVAVVVGIVVHVAAFLLTIVIAILVGIVSFFRRK